MAGLRSDAVQARRLAEHIENLPRDAAVPQRKWKPVMTDTNIVDPGHAQRLKRRADDRPAPGGSQMSFNPLHPSMELPPEQLIRLLGMESKKTRKVRKTRKTARPAPAAATRQQAKPQQSPATTETPKKVSRPARSIRYEDSQPPMFEDKRRNLLVPALLVGVVAGITVSAYLLLSQPVPVTEQKPVAATTSPVKKVPTATKPPTSKPAAAMSIQEQAQWQAAAQKENQRLRNTAEQLFAERVMQLEAAAEITEATPAADPTPAPATQPAMDEQPLNTPETPANNFRLEASFDRLLDDPLSDTSDTPVAADSVPEATETTEAVTVPVAQDTLAFPE